MTAEQIRAMIAQALNDPDELARLAATGIDPWKFVEFVRAIEGAQVPQVKTAGFGTLLAQRPEPPTISGYPVAPRSIGDIIVGG